MFCFGFFFNDKGCPVSLEMDGAKKEQTFKVFKRFLNATLMHAKIWKKVLYCHEWILGNFSFKRRGDWQT